MQIIDGGVETDASARSRGDPGEHLVHRRRLSDACEFTAQVLLERLARCLGAPLQAGMDVVGKIADQNVRHAFIMLALNSRSNPRATRQTTGLVRNRNRAVPPANRCGQHAHDPLINTTRTELVTALAQWFSAERESSTWPREPPPGAFV